MVVLRGGGGLVSEVPLGEMSRALDLEGLVTCRNLLLVVSGSLGGNEGLFQSIVVVLNT